MTSRRHIQVTKGVYLTYVYALGALSQKYNTSLHKTTFLAQWIWIKCDKRSSLSLPKLQLCSNFSSTLPAIAFPFCVIVSFPHCTIIVLKDKCDYFQGKVESILISEVRLRLHDSRVNQGLNIFSKDQKLQLLISDFEVYLRSPVQSTKKSKPRTRSSPSLGKGAWMFMSNIAKHLALCVTELNVKVCSYERW